jgi:uncharacterized protein
MHKPVVLITGASGFIGSHFIPFLVTRGYRVVALSRRSRTATHGVSWVTDLKHIEHQYIDYVVNLAGENIGQGRWTATRQQKLIDSRVQSTEQLYQYLIEKNIYPKAIISGSAVGYYGIDPEQTWQQVCTEESASQSIFMSALCQKWEYSALKFSQLNSKIIRLGVVFAKQGGILPQMLLPIKLGLVGKIGTGQQPVAWVHIQDVLRAIEFLMRTETQQRIFNVVAPELTTQAHFAEQAAQVLAKRPFLSAPAWLFQTLLGEQSQLILNGQFVTPKNLSDAGFIFHFQSLRHALQNLKQSKRSAVADL